MQFRARLKITKRDRSSAIICGFPKVISLPFKIWKFKKIWFKKYWMKRTVINKMWSQTKNKTMLLLKDRIFLERRWLMTGESCKINYPNIWIIWKKTRGKLKGREEIRCYPLSQRKKYKSLWKNHHPTSILK
jgi:hypothetical protein